MRLNQDCVEWRKTEAYTQKEVIMDYNTQKGRKVCFITIRIPAKQKN